jgi:hypothetical protein
MEDFHFHAIGGGVKGWTSFNLHWFIKIKGAID